MVEIILHDYFGKVIPWNKADEYYKDFNMSPESMQMYELYKQSIIKENEKIERTVKSLKSKIFEERDKFISYLNKTKWGGSSPSPASQ
jgi:hypothetical protein